MHCRANDQIFKAVEILCTNPANVVVILSGTTSAKLAAEFASDKVWLAAENGVYVRPPKSLWEAFDIHDSVSSWLCLYENLNLSWVASVLQACLCFMFVWTCVFAVVPIIYILEGTSFSGL
jgi:trehalose-6-phosphatase